MARTRTIVEKICESCGTVYRCGQDRQKIRKYCSLKCVPRPKRQVSETTKVSRTCVACDSIFYVYPSNLKGKGKCCQFCSRECRKEHTKAKKLKPLTSERLKELLHYDPKTGIFTWLKMPGHAVHSVNVGDRAGNERKGRKNYRFIEILGNVYAEHRLAWLYMTGKWPEKQVDHWDRQCNNNAWDNLNEANNSENQINRPYKKGKNPYRGVAEHRRSDGSILYSARLAQKYIGYYSSAEEARDVYIEAAKAKYGKFFKEEFF